MSVSEDSSPPLVKQSFSPGEFLAKQRRLLQMMYYDNHKVDIEGQLAAGQYATCALLARVALERGIRVYLLDRGETGALDHNVWALFRRVAGPRSQLFRAATTLLHRNPSADDETRAYAEDCVRFVETVLGVEPMGYRSEASFDVYAATVQGIGRLAGLLNQ